MSGVDWPILDYAIAWRSGPADDPASDFWYSVTSRTEGTTTSTRGKEYELDQVQPGELDFTLRNDDGAFDPTNTASPFYPDVVAYRLCRLRAQYPATPSNQLTPDQSTAFYATQGAVTTATLPSGAAAYTGVPVTIAPHDASSNQYVVPAAFAYSGDKLLVSQFSIEQAVTLTAQAQFSCAVSVGLRLRLDWYGAAGTLLSSSTGATATGLSGTPTVSGAPPAGAFGARVVVEVVTGTVAAPLNVFKLGIETAASASAWTTPGTWYPMFTGYIERWPQGWDAAGSYGTVALTAVDRFTWLANRNLNSAAFLELLSTSPWRFCPLNEESGSKSFVDYLGLRADAVIYTPRSGVFQTITPGNALQSDSGAVPPAGIEGPVVTFTNQPSQTAAQLIDLTGGGANTGFGVGVGGQWTRVFAFRVPKTAALAGTGASLMRAYQKDPYSDSFISVGGVYDGSGNFTAFQAAVVNGGTTVASATAVGSLSDGSWHLAAIAVNNGTNTLSLWLDGQPVTASTTGTFPTKSTGTDVLGGRLTIASKSTPGPAADIAMCADWLRILTNTEVSNLWEAFQYGWGSQSPNRDESSSVRYQRLLNWAGTTGTPRIDAGATVQYGPATDLTSDSKLLDALQAVVDTEAGQHYLAGDGQIVFKSRRARFNPAPTVTFGENVGEIAYLNASTDFDPTLVVNDSTATAQYGEGAAATSYRLTDTASGNTYGDLAANRTVNTLDSAELLGAAQYVLYEGKQPMLRLEALPVDVGNNPTYWPTLLALDLGSPVTWNRRPPNAPAITMAGFVEQIAWSIDDQRHASWTAQLSNAALHQFGVFDDTTYGKFNSTLIFGY